MGRKTKHGDTPDSELEDEPSPETAAELAKRHLQEALERKQQSLAGKGGQAGNAPVKGSVSHHGAGPAKGRNFRHQGR